MLLISPTIWDIELEPQWSLGHRKPRCAEQYNGLSGQKQSPVDILSHHKRARGQFGATGRQTAQPGCMASLRPVGLAPQQVSLAPDLLTVLAAARRLAL
jgi:hypothetical protein